MKELRHLRRLLGVALASLFLWGAPWRCTETEFQFLKRVIAKHGERVK